MESLGYIGRKTLAMIPLPLLPVLAAGLVPFLIGAFWYHPRVFGARWMSLKHITPELAERASRLAMRSTATMIMLGIVAAVILSRILIALQIETLGSAVVTAFSIWIAFVVPATINRVLWDHATLSLYAIETGQWLVSLTVMSIVLAY